ncbi:hypothetical protein DIJ64_03765 [Mycobacterium leprae]|uniref:Uncharacterized protein n=1 Tax=Mycobacterium leprae TaxID=1769 RepID=A0AAD0P4L5_MYCLR|nr:MFS transporter [Mycobacterium leprae]AWV47525.1 hypothetical protein DIJ64_03765 [Mycobacterium leprae]OAR21717.1 hypothetical protein A8144_00455 [Mycobacterium leprae 3125609]OAX72256.1 hypothetical protein A3216_00520 [Mycobacterium leprae 7935681]
MLGQIAKAFSASVLTNAIGRQKSIVLIPVGYMVFALLGARSVSSPMLLAGPTISMTVVIVPVYLGESSPVAVRGSWLTTY